MDTFQGICVIRRWVLCKWWLFILRFISLWLEIVIPSKNKSIETKSIVIAFSSLIDKFFTALQNSMSLFSPHINSLVRSSLVLSNPWVRLREWLTFYWVKCVFRRYTKPKINYLFRSISNYCLLESCGVWQHHQLRWIQQSLAIKMLTTKTHKWNTFYSFTE